MISFISTILRELITVVTLTSILGYLISLLLKPLWVYSLTSQQTQNESQNKNQNENQNQN